MVAVRTLILVGPRTNIMEMSAEVMCRIANAPNSTFMGEWEGTQIVSMLERVEKCEHEAKKSMRSFIILSVPVS